MENSSPKKCLGNHLNRYRFTHPGYRPPSGYPGWDHPVGNGEKHWVFLKGMTRDVENDGRDDKIWYHAMGWDGMRQDEIWWDTMTWDELRKDMMRHYEKSWKIMRNDWMRWDYCINIWDEMRWDLIRHDETWWDQRRPEETRRPEQLVQYLTLGPNEELSFDQWDSYILDIII